MGNNGDQDKKQSSSTPGTNADINAQGAGINPSAPTTGTEGWGTTSDERRVLSGSDPADTRAGQMKGNPGDDRTSATQKMGGGSLPGDRTSSADGSGDAGDKRVDVSRGSSASAHSMNSSHGHSTFRCADAGNADCPWETSAATEDEIMQRAEAHGRQDHGMTDWTLAMRNKVKDAIQRREAA